MLQNVLPCNLNVFHAFYFSQNYYWFNLTGLLGNTKGPFTPRTITIKITITINILATHINYKCSALTPCQCCYFLIISRKKNCSESDSFCHYSCGVDAAIFSKSLSLSSLTQVNPFVKKKKNKPYYVSCFVVSSCVDPSISLYFLIHCGCPLCCGRGHVRDRAVRNMW